MMKWRNQKSREAAQRAAVDWWMRRRAGPLAGEERAAFEAWRADPVNAAAYDNIAGLCAHIAALPDAPAARMAVPARGLRLAAAASLATASLAAVLLWSDVAILLRSDYSTGTGETRLVALEDGSHVHLNARSAIALRFGPSQRRLELLSGEAWFEVAPDARRPFVVAAAGGEIEALGTAFDVALEDKGARVAVTEHKVRVSSGGAEVVVAEGEQSAYAARSAASRPDSIKAGWIAAWRRGKLIVENAPLREVIAALGRYHHGVVVCVKASICERGVTGVFSTEDPGQSLDAIEKALGARATSFTRFVTLLHD